MIDFLSNLVSRHLGRADSLQPRHTGLFEPTPPHTSWMLGGDSAEALKNELELEDELTSEAGSARSSVTRALTGAPPEAKTLQDKHEPSSRQSPEPEDPPENPNPKRLQPVQLKQPVATGPLHDELPIGDPQPLLPATRAYVMPEPANAAMTGFSNLAHDATINRFDARVAWSLTQSDASESTVGLDSAPKPAAEAGESTSIGRPAVKRESLKPQIRVHVEDEPGTATPIPPVSDEPATVNVTIGRVEVRAVMPETPPPPRKKTTKSGPSMSLDDYLKRREGNQR